MPKSLSDQLKAAAEASGESWYRIAKDSGIDYGTLHRFLSGERDVRLETANRLAAYLGLELRPKAKPKKRAKKA